MSQSPCPPPARRRIPAWNDREGNSGERTPEPALRFSERASRRGKEGSAEPPQSSAGRFFGGIGYLGMQCAGTIAKWNAETFATFAAVASSGSPSSLNAL